MTKLRFTPQADEDVIRAALWYEKEREGLGIRFLERVEEAVDRIKAAPLGHQKVLKEARKCEIERFPYALWYSVEPDGNVVIGCLHGKRNRALVRERVSGVIELPKRDL